jgi:predicted AlkP superfamily pyrophosphatase or phosphodiesterase
VEAPMKKNIIIIGIITLVLFSCHLNRVNGKLVYHYKILPEDVNAENKHVFLIGLDGWGGYSFERSNMPTVNSMIIKGSYTFKALSVMPSITIPNWASMFMGAGPDVHGYKTNPPTYNDPPYTESEIIDVYGIFPSIFTLLKGQRPNCKVSFFYEKPKIGYLCPDNVIDRKENIVNLSYDPSTISIITDYIKSEKPNFTVIVFREPDGVGHGVGHNTSAYYSQLNNLDVKITEIIQAIKDAGIFENSIIIFSSDHGGIGIGHGNDTPAEREIPFIVAGKNIKENYGLSQPVMTYDIAATIAYIFNLEPPYFWEGKVLKNIFKDNSPK